MDKKQLEQAIEEQRRIIEAAQKRYEKDDAAFMGLSKQADQLTASKAQAQKEIRDAEGAINWLQSQLTAAG